MALPSINRLPLRFERERIDKEGSPIHSRLFIVVKAASPKGINNPRFAVLISKKISNLAVARNRLKRQILGSIQTILPLVPVADYLIIPKKTTKEVEFSLLTSDLKDLLL